MKQTFAEQRNALLSKEDIAYLESVGFKQDAKLRSGFYCQENVGDNEYDLIVPQEDGTYKLENHYWGYDDGEFFDDCTKYFSEKGQSLKDFLSEWYE